MGGAIVTQIIRHRNATAVKVNSSRYIAKLRNELGDLRHYDVKHRADGWFIVLMDMDDDGPYETLTEALDVIIDWYEVR